MKIRTKRYHSFEELAKDWNETLHPRIENGEFAPENGESRQEAKSYDLLKTMWEESKHPRTQTGEFAPKGEGEVHGEPEGEQNAPKDIQHMPFRPPNDMAAFELSDRKWMYNNAMGIYHNILVTANNANLVSSDDAAKWSSALADAARRGDPNEMMHVANNVDTFLQDACSGKTKGKDVERLLNDERKLMSNDLMAHQKKREVMALENTKARLDVMLHKMHKLGFMTSEREAELRVKLKNSTNKEQLNDVNNALKNAIADKSPGVDKAHMEGELARLQGRAAAEYNGREPTDPDITVHPDYQGPGRPLSGTIARTPEKPKEPVPQDIADMRGKHLGAMADVHAFFRHKNSASELDSTAFDKLDAVWGNAVAAMRGARNPEEMDIVWDAFAHEAEKAAQDAGFNQSEYEGMMRDAEAKRKGAEPQEPQELKVVVKNHFNAMADIRNYFFKRHQKGEIKEDAWDKINNVFDRVWVKIQAAKSEGEINVAYNEFIANADNLVRDNNLSPTTYADVMADAGRHRLHGLTNPPAPANPHPATSVSSSVPPVSPLTPSKPSGAVPQGGHTADDLAARKEAHKKALDVLKEFVNGYHDKGKISDTDHEQLVHDLAAYKDLVDQGQDGSVVGHAYALAQKRVAQAAARIGDSSAAKEFNRLRVKAWRVKQQPEAGIKRRDAGNEPVPADSGGGETAFKHWKNYFIGANFKMPKEEARTYAQDYFQVAPMSSLKVDPVVHIPDKHANYVDCMDLENGKRALWKPDKAGSAPAGEYGTPHSEYFTYLSSLKMGFGDIVPPCLMRFENAKTGKGHFGSLHYWHDNVIKGGDANSDGANITGHHGDTLPVTQKLKDQFSEMAAMDFALINRDRNSGNWMLDTDTGDLVANDNGLCALEYGRQSHGLHDLSSVLGSTKGHLSSVAEALFGDNSTHWISYVKPEDIQKAKTYVDSKEYERTVRQCFMRDDAIGDRRVASNREDIKQFVKRVIIGSRKAIRELEQERKDYDASH